MPPHLPPPSPISACAGAIPALSLLLQSPSCMARQAAARAVSNLVVHNGGWMFGMTVRVIYFFVSSWAHQCDFWYGCVPVPLVVRS